MRQGRAGGASASRLAVPVMPPPALVPPAYHNDPSLISGRAAPPTVRRTLPLRRPVPTRPAYSAIGWCALGFVSGIVCWHFVGFWGFVSDVVFRASPNHRNATSTQQLVATGDRRKLQTTVYGGIPTTDQSNAGACTLLQLDRNSGRTTALTCNEGAQPIEGSTGRYSQPPTPLPSTTPPLARAISPAPPAGPIPVPPDRRVPSVAGWSASIKKPSEDDSGGGPTMQDNIREALR